MKLYKNPAGGVSEICNDEGLRQWPRLEIMTMANRFCGMINRRKALCLTSVNHSTERIHHRHHWKRSSPQIFSWKISKIFRKIFYRVPMSFNSMRKRCQCIKLNFKYYELMLVIPFISSLNHQVKRKRGRLKTKLNIK